MAQCSGQRPGGDSLVAFRACIDHSSRLIEPGYGRNRLEFSRFRANIRPVDATNRPLAMPSLFRFLIFVAVTAGVTYGGMFLLAQFYNPSPREITVSVPVPNQK